MVVLNLLLLLDLMICMQMSLKGLRVRQLCTTRGTNSLPSLVPMGFTSFWPFFDLPFCHSCDGSNHWVSIGFFVVVGTGPTKMSKDECEFFTTKLRMNNLTQLKGGQNPLKLLYYIMILNTIISRAVCLGMVEGAFSLQIRGAFKQEKKLWSASHVSYRRARFTPILIILGVL